MLPTAVNDVDIRYIYIYNIYFNVLVTIIEGARGKNWAEAT